VSSLDGKPILMGTYKAQLWKSFCDAQDVKRFVTRRAATPHNSRVVHRAGRGPFWRKATLEEISESTLRSDIEVRHYYLRDGVPVPVYCRERTLRGPRLTAVFGDGQPVLEDGAPVNWTRKQKDRAPMHMPKSWARSWGVLLPGARIERLGDITDDDLRLEMGLPDSPIEKVRCRFWNLWRELHGEKPNMEQLVWRLEIEVR